ncbi:MAG: hypothetical protein EOO29_08715 [Comamonadaceae bacterium]|nr:MAG: hypothetical protein EOO29_08715 [Comamonadaceae bacterium]
MTTTPFVLTFCDAADDGSLYLTGVVKELENGDVPHVMLWERIAGEWKRYQWGNRCYGLATYLDAGRPSTAYLGYDGTLKVRSQVHGSTVETLEVGDDTPSSLRTVTCIRLIGDQLFVVGMRRMVYRRGVEESAWYRFDNGMRLVMADRAIAGLRAIDGSSPTELVAVGLDGEIWSHSNALWRREESPTNIRLADVRCMDASTYVIGGADGVLMVGAPGRWQMVDHDFPAETFRRIEKWSGRCFVCTESGMVFELSLAGAPALAPLPVAGLQAVYWIAASAKRVYFLGASSVWSLGDDGWKDESPPAALMA